jgi:MFS family permease
VYRLDWIEQLKLRLTAAPSASGVRSISPVVWSLGWTSLLTDISTEMVNSVLPVYLVLHLRLSPLQYGVIDGLYNGFAIALLSLAAGFTADRWRRQKEVAAVGYGLSALCKLLLPASGAAWGWIAAVIGLDRAGKGMRSAPRDAIISFCTPKPMLASAFALHRALDAGGALIGPVIAFILLARLPQQFDVMWATSFVFAVIGLAVLWLYVPPSKSVAPVQNPKAPRLALGSLFALPRFRALAICGLLLAASTVSDGFVYLLLQQRGSTPAGFLPLFYVGTACAYMLFSMPAGLIADRWGRTRVLMGGYAVLAVVYLVLFGSQTISVPMQVLCLVLLGMYYAGTEGVLMAMASAVVPEGSRTSGLAVIGTAIGIGKMISSLVFGWLWTSQGALPALLVFAGILACMICVSALWLRGTPSAASNT